MSEGLKALKRYREIPTTIDYDIIERELKDYEKTKQDLEQVMKDYQDLGNSCYKKLKALEIIKKKRVDIGYLTHLIVKHNDDKKILQTYNMNVWTYAYEWKDCIIDKTMILTQEEYDLLKEVLL